MDNQQISLNDETGAPSTVNVNTGFTGARLSFNSSGDFISQEPAGGFQTAALGASILTNGSDESQTIIIDFNLDTAGVNSNEPTQFASGFEVTSLEQNGLPVGRLNRSRYWS